jgi:nucleotide-binding universal stress UspA family protein
MYKRILVALENSPTDNVILDHVKQLAKSCAATLIFVHVADGFAARNLKQLSMRESEEMRVDREYIERICADFEQQGFESDAVLAAGDPAAEIASLAEREECDLIAMSTHGHRFLKDMMYGSVASEVRHLSMVPVLLVRAPAGNAKST